jgi:ABC-type lipoprotein release transport system permease subunit
MLKTIFRLFRTTLYFQVILAFICFVVVMGFVLARLIYLHGLTASFSGTKSHLSITFAEGASTDPSRVHQIAEYLNKLPTVATASPFVKTSRILHIKSLDDNIFDEPEVSQAIEIIAIDLDLFPFAIPLEEAKSLKRPEYHNPYTYKELAYALSSMPDAVVVNQALSSLFSTSLEYEGSYNVSREKTSGYLGEIKILAIMKDLEDVPKLYTSLKTAEMLLNKLEYEGVLVRLEHPEDLERVQQELTISLARKWDLNTLNIKNWKEEENKQKKIFEVFNALFWPIISIIMIMSLFGCILGIYRTFIVKRDSLQIMLNMGMSRRQLFGILAGINTGSLALGLVLSFWLQLLLKESFATVFLGQLKQIVKVEQVLVPWHMLWNWVLGLFAIYLAVFLLFLWLILLERKQTSPRWRIGWLNRLLFQWRRFRSVLSISVLQKSNILGRPGIVSRVLFRNVEMLILFGLAIGVVLGLGIAVGGNLFIRHTMNSYQQFVQRSLIGVRGSLVLTASPIMIESFLKQESDGIDLPMSIAWNSPQPMRIELKQGRSKLKIQAQIILAEREYLFDKLERQNTCHAKNLIGNIAFGNQLLIRALSGMDIQQSFSLQVKKLRGERHSVRFSDQTACTIDTGMMTDYPVLFLTWEGLRLNPLSFSRKASLEFYTRDRRETDYWQLKLKRIMEDISIRLSNQSGVRPGDLDVEPPLNLFDSSEMELANNISKQAGYLSVLIVVVTGFFAVVILIYGFSLLLELKRKILQTIQEMGMNNGEVAAGFMLRGFRIGLAAAVTGIVAALGVRFLIESRHWIPYQHFFKDWNLIHFAIVLIVVPLSVGLFSVTIVRLLLAEPWKRLKIRWHQKS